MKQNTAFNPWEGFSFVGTSTPCDRTNILNRILGWLKDQGQLDVVLDLAHLLLKRSELSIPLLRDEIQF